MIHQQRCPLGVRILCFGLPALLGLALNPGVGSAQQRMVTLTVTGSPVEAGSSVTVTVTISSTRSSPTTIHLNYQNLNASANDYSGPDSLVIAANASSASGTITTTADADAGTERFTVGIKDSSGPGWERGSPNFAAVTITPPASQTPTVSLRVNPERVDEGDAATVRVTISRAQDTELKIPLTVTLGTAEQEDFTAPDTIVIRANRTSGERLIRTNHDPDTDDDAFTLAFGTLPSGVDAGSPASATVTIVDDGVSPVRVSLAASPGTVDEGSDVTVTATLSGTLTTDVTIPLTLTAGSAEGGDYGSLASITISRGQRSGTGTITTAQDADAQDETFTVALGSLPHPVLPGSPNSVEITIDDDEVAVVPPTVSLSVDSDRVNEGSPVTVTVTLSATLANDVTIPMVVSLGSAEQGDVGSLASITVTRGERTGTGTITTAQDPDSDNETFSVLLGSVLPATVRRGSPATVQITIVDDEGVPTVNLSVPGPRVNEGSSVTVTATLSSPLANNVTIPLTLTRGTAERDDFGSLASIAIVGGQRSGTGTITTAQDADSDNETFTVALASNLPSGVRRGTSAMVEITIVDNTASTPNAPDPPTSLTAGAHSGSSGIRVSWRAPSQTGSSAIARYIVYGGTSAAPTAELGRSTTTEFTYSTVSPNTTYYFRVRAVNRDGHTSAYSSEVSFTTTALPRSITDLRAFGGPAQITLGWSAPSNTQGLQHYQVQVATTSARVFGNLAQASSPFHSHTGLPDHVQRWYRVRAVYTGNINGPWSNVATATTSAQPDAPRNLTAQRLASEVSLSWLAPAPSTTNSLRITGYRIEHSEGGGAGWVSLASVGAGVTRYLHSSVPAKGQTVFYRVIALSASGESSPSGLAQVTTPAERPSPPDAVSATPSATAVTVTWAAPADDGGSPVTGYQIEVSTNRALWRVVATSVSPSSLEFTHTGLSPATTYFYRVSARNSVGLSGPSSVAQAETPPTAPGRPRQLVAHAMSYSEIQLTWRPPESTGGSRITGYKIERSPDRGSSWFTIREQTGTEGSSFLDRDLEPATVYQYRVSAVSEAGVGEPSGVAEATTYGPPGQPRALLAMTQSRSEILLEWQAPDTVGTAPVTGYRIERSADGGVSWLTIRPSTGMTTTSYLDRELQPGRLYRYRVSAESPAGPSEPSEFAEARTHGPPGIPRDLIADAVSREQINLWWSPPDSDGGVPLTGYILEFSGDGGGSWEVLSHLSDERTYAHAGLRAGRIYYYRVRAVNEIGAGLPSAMAHARTLADIPEPPRDLSAHAPASDRIDLRWRPPAHDGGSAVTGYFIEASTDAGATWFIVAESHSGVRFAHTGLAPATRYFYRVSAINAVGTSTPSAHAEAVTTADVPAAPPDLVAEAVSHDRIELRWTKPGNDGGSPIQGYRIDVSDDGGASWVPLADNTSMTKTSYSHTGLQHATVYRYRVAAINEAGRGNWSAHAEARTHAMVPGSPRALTATVVAHHQIELAWEPPESDGGAPVTMTVVEASTDEREWSVLAEVRAPERRFAHVGAEAGVTWSYRVSAVNGAGRGPVSNVASAVIDDAARRSERVSAAILPWFTATAAGSAVNAISDRVTGAARGVRSEARVNLAGAENGLRNLTDGAAVSRSAGSFSVWASGDLSGLARTGGTVEYDGQVMSLHAGLDGMMSRSVMLGVAGNRSTGAFEFTDRTHGRDMSGDYEAALTTIAPYVAWVSEDVSVWVAPGIGQGVLTITDSAAARNSDIASSMVAIGGSSQLRSTAAGSFGLSADGWTANVQVAGNVPAGLAPDGNPERIDEATFTTRRARLMLDWRVVRRMPGGNDIEAVLRGGARRDWHSTETGAVGAELGGEMRLTSRHVRVRGAGRMFVHAGHREWGVRGTLEVTSWQENGLTVQASPSYGVADSGVEALWNNGVGWSGSGGVPVTSPSAAPAAHLGVSAAYRPPGRPLALVGRYDSAQRALTFGTELARTIDWLVESRYSGRGGLALSFQGSHRF